MLKVNALWNVQNAPVKAHLVKLYWRRWVNAEEIAVDLGTTIANVELHMNQFQYYHVPCYRRISGKGIQFKIGG